MLGRIGRETDAVVAHADLHVGALHVDHDVDPWHLRLARELGRIAQQIHEHRAQQVGIRLHCRQFAAAQRGPLRAGSGQDHLLEGGAHDPSELYRLATRGGLAQPCQVEHRADHAHRCVALLGDGGQGTMGHRRVTPAQRVRRQPCQLRHAAEWPSQVVRHAPVDRLEAGDQLVQVAGALDDPGFEEYVRLAQSGLGSRAAGDFPPQLALAMQQADGQHDHAERGQPDAGKVLQLFRWHARRLQKEGQCRHDQQRDPQAEVILARPLEGASQREQGGPHVGQQNADVEHLVPHRLPDGQCRNEHG